MSKYLIVAFVILIIGFSSFFVYTAVRGKNNSESQTGNEISLDTYQKDGKLYADITATAAGFSPNKLNLNSNTEIILRAKNINNYSCTSVIRIAKLNILEKLPYNGEKEIVIPPQPAGTKLIATCSSGANTIQMNFY
ncbi:MAG: cupredoxin domain-containing protein [Candidatus Dojkabacteria bacterium]|nr:cupredoxin domain-containing protein [Candidatus Dojkabacteria bacterium]